MLSRQKRRGKKNMNTFHKYLNSVNQSIQDDLQLSNQAKVVLDRLLHDILDKLTEGARIVGRLSKVKTLRQHEIQAATALLFPPELYRHANFNANQAIEKLRQSYMQSKGMSSGVNQVNQGDECHCDVKYACKMYCDSSRGGGKGKH